MTPVEEQQMLASLAEISQGINALLTLTKDMAIQRDKTSEKAIQHLLNIAHKR